MQDGMDATFLPGRVFSLVAMLLLLLVATPLAIHWLQGSGVAVPDCASAQVIQLLRQQGGIQVPLYHIHSVGIDHRLGHRICYALTGRGGAERQLKYAVYFSATDNRVVLVLTGDQDRRATIDNGR